jgi:hypothetical protein
LRTSPSVKGIVLDHRRKLKISLRVREDLLVIKPVVDKLGWKQGAVSRVFHCPANVWPLLSGIENSDAERLDWQLRFVLDSAAIVRDAPLALQAYVQGGHFWMAYPKLSGSIVTDISRDKGWEPVFKLDMLAVTQIAIDSDWSALRFRRRIEIKKLTRKF